MFLIPTMNREGRVVINDVVIRRAKSKFIDFGGHTKNHVYLTDILISDVDAEIKDNKDYLEDILGQEVKHFCFPGGKYNSEIIDVVKKYYKTTRTADTMSFVAKDDFLIKPAIHLYPRGKKSIIGNCLRNKSYKEMICVIHNIRHSDFDIYKRLLLEDVSDVNKDIIIWGHSWEINEKGLWYEVESMFRFINEGFLSSVVHYDCLNNG